MAAYGQWMPPSYPQTSSPDQVQYPAAQQAQYMSANGQSQPRNVYDQTAPAFSQNNGQTFAAQGATWPNSNYNYGSFVQQPLQGQAFNAQGQYGQASSFDSDQAMASGPYITSPTTAVDQTAAWTALYNEWAPR